MAVLLLTVTSVHAQSPATVVGWTASYVASADGQGTLRVFGAIATGWHVYAFQQAADGPIPLRITVTDNSRAAQAGPVIAPEPLHSLDRGFGFETFYFAERVTATLPLRLLQPGTSADPAIPVAIRFQACSEGLCLPPTTAHLSATPAPIDTATGATP